MVCQSFPLTCFPRISLFRFILRTDSDRKVSIRPYPRIHRSLSLPGLMWCFQVYITASEVSLTSILYHSAPTEYSLQLPLVVMYREWCCCGKFYSVGQKQQHSREQQNLVVTPELSYTCMVGSLCAYQYEQR